MGLNSKKILKINWLQTIHIVAEVSNMRPANYFSKTHHRTIFVINISLKLGNLFLASDHVSPQTKVEEYTLIFQSFSLQNPKQKIRNNPILHTLKTFLLRTLAKYSSTYFGGGVTMIIKHWLIHENIRKFLFHNVTRNKFDNSYWHKGCT